MLLVILKKNPPQNTNMRKHVSEVHHGLENFTHFTHQSHPCHRYRCVKNHDNNIDIALNPRSMLVIATSFKNVLMTNKETENEQSS